MMKEITQRGDIILFIDELHNLVGAGAAEGAIDAASILQLHEAVVHALHLGPGVAGQRQHHLLDLHLAGVDGPLGDRRRWRSRGR